MATALSTTLLFDGTSMSASASGTFDANPERPVTIGVTGTGTYTLQLQVGNAFVDVYALLPETGTGGVVTLSVAGVATRLVNAPGIYRLSRTGQGATDTAVVYQ
jgi:hypothetical protein